MGIILSNNILRGKICPFNHYKANYSSISKNTFRFLFSSEMLNNIQVLGLNAMK